MATVEVDVDVDLDMFSMSEIIQHVKDNLNTDGIIKEFDLDDEDFGPLSERATVKDKMKYDFFMENFDNITLEQLEGLVRN